LAGLLVAAGLFGCHGEEASGAPGGAGGGGAGKSAGGPGGGRGGGGPAPVRVAQAETRDVPIEIQTFGTVEPLSTVEVKAQVAGEITKVSFKEGDFVTAGQELFTIDPRPYAVALAQAEANLARAEAEVSEARSNVQRSQVEARNAQTELERNRTLLERGMVTQAEFDQTRTAAESMQAGVGAVEASVRSGQEGIRAAQAAIDQAKLSLEYCTIRAPIDGRTGSLLTHQGNLVRQNDTEPMVVLTQTKPIYVSFTLPEKELPAVRQRMAEGAPEVRAFVPGQEDQSVAGTLTFIDNTVDPETSTIRLKGTFDNADEKLWPGQYLECAVVLGIRQGAVTVPAQAVQSGQQGSYVYVVGAANKAELRLVRTGVANRGSLEVVEGVQAGESVVTEGHLRLAPDMAVKILEAGAPAENAKP
jgi:multidrug efflux system membrane fusion protein